MYDTAASIKNKVEILINGSPCTPRVKILIKTILNKNCFVNSLKGAAEFFLNGYGGAEEQIE